MARGDKRDKVVDVLSKMKSMYDRASATTTLTSAVEVSGVCKKMSALARTMETKFSTL